MARDPVCFQRDYGVSLLASHTFTTYLAWVTGWQVKDGESHTAVICRAKWMMASLAEKHALSVLILPGPALWISTTA